MVTAKLELAFVLTFENAFSQSFHFQANRKGIGSSKKRFQGFSKQPSVYKIACCYVAIRESFKRFQYFDFETNFLENENLLQKTGVPFFTGTTKIENTFPFKIALSQANVKTNRTATTKWTYHKEWSSTSN